MRISSFKSIFIVLVTALSLAGCNGSDNAPAATPTPPANKAPAAIAGPDHRVDEKQEDTLKGAGTDADGKVAAYSWKQVSGPDVKLTVSDSDPASVSYTAPDVSETATLAFELTVTDDDGATATDTVDVTVAPTVTMQGRVVDGPISNATVTVTIGDKTYTATAGADGTYTLNVGAVDPDAFISITATGTGDQSNVQLISIAGTFDALATAAGDDAILAPSESTAVNVTNLSTAQAALILDANDGDMPTDDAALTDLQKSIDSDAMLELATVIKLVIDKNVPLPDGVDNTLDLVKDDTAVDDVIQTAEDTDPGSFDATMDEILSDPALTSAFTPDTVPSMYFVSSAHPYVGGSRGSLWTFNADGTGRLHGINEAASTNFTWSVDDNGELVVKLDPNDPIIGGGSCSTASGLVFCQTTWDSVSFRRLTHTGSVDTLEKSTQVTRTYPNNPELASEQLEGSSVMQGLPAAGLEPFTAADVVGTWSTPLALPDPEGSASYVTDLLTFNADGSGIRPGDGATFQWSIDPDSGVVDIDFATGDTLTVYWIRSDGELGIDGMVVLTTAAKDVYTMESLIVRGVDKDFAATLTLADFDGPQRYMDWPGYDLVIDANAGTGVWTNYDENHVITNQFGPVSVTYNGIYLENTTFFDADSGQVVTSCTGVARCYESQNDKWYPLAKDSSGRIFVLEDEHDWDFDSTAVDDYYRGAVYFRDHVNRWFKLDDGKLVLPAAPAGINQPARGDRVRKALGGDTLDLRTHAARAESSK
ncbi:MAG TPA: hypothetical protein VFH85_01375 [Gammaproteobacteria bacterium]|nr:hypothetical protein [Gammaproteobacteria bacterium]